jgi:hypothetical protein
LVICALVIWLLKWCGKIKKRRRERAQFGDQESWNSEAYEHIQLKKMGPPRSINSIAFENEKKSDGKKIPPPRPPPPNSIAFENEKKSDGKKMPPPRPPPPKITIEFTKKKLELPWANRCWELNVTNPVNTKEVWACLTDYSVSCWLS